MSIYSHKFYCVVTDDHIIACYTDYCEAELKCEEYNKTNKLNKVGYIETYIEINEHNMGDRKITYIDITNGCRFKYV